MSGWLALAATTAPVTPDTPPDELVTPGTVGFLATFAIAVALVFLVRDMNRRVQRIQVRRARVDTGAVGPVPVGPVPVGPVPVGPVPEAEPKPELPPGDGAATRPEPDDRRPEPPGAAPSG